MAEVAHVLVVLRRAGEPERVVPPDRVADDLDERLEIVVEELRVEARLGVRAPHQRPGGGRVEPALLARLQLPGVEREEVGALASLDVDDLDVLPRLHLVGERRGPVDLEVEPRVGERLRETRLELLERPRPGDLELEVGRGEPAVDDRLARRRCPDDHEERPLRPKRRLRARRRRRPEEHRRLRARRVGTACRDRRDDLRGTVLVRPHERPEDRRVAVRRDAEPVEAVRAEAEHGELGALAAVEVANREPVVRLEQDRRRRPAPDAVSLASGVARHEPRDEQARAGGGGHGSYAFAGSFASWASASATSCSASSRLPAASSFLTSFSTARRLYDWFQ